MADDVRTFAVTTPPATSLTAPLVTDMAMPARTVRSVRVRVPPGPRGVMGWRLAAAGVGIIPSNAGGFIVGNDEEIDWTLDNQIDSGAWQLMTYNVGVYPHTVYVTFALDTIRPAVAGVPSAPLNITP